MSVGALGYGGSDQLAFDFPMGSPRVLEGTYDNIYFAVLPEVHAARRMTEIAAELRHRHQLRGGVQPAQLLHISLAHVGRFMRVPECAVTGARRAGDAVSFAPFDVTFDRAISFDNPRRRPLVLRCSKGDVGLTRLGKCIHSAMARGGLHRDRPIGRTPHVTLVYDGRTVPEVRLDEPITWRVREFVLVQNLVGRGRHLHLGRWTLNG